MTVRIGKVVTILYTAALLAGCASSSEDIGAAYVSPLTYKDYDCDQVAAELQRVSARASQLGGEVDENATGDAVAMGVGLVLFWPALFFIDGNGPEANEYARLKGEYEALQQASIQKKCGMQPTTTTAAAQPPAAAAPAESAAGSTSVPATESMTAASQQTASSAAPAANVGTPASQSEHWTGVGARDGCGEPYTIDVFVKDKAVKGRLDRGDASYAINGQLNYAGDLEGSLASLTNPAASNLAAEFVTLKLDFGGETTAGGFSTFDGKRFDCTTVVTLQRAADES